MILCQNDNLVIQTYNKVMQTDQIFEDQISEQSYKIR